jgi:predicted DNA-binding protein (UPF0251 family)/predicted RNA-binding Zn-ribbon protein involved in translation (DUF1610 family)
MPRPRKHRTIESVPGATIFKPGGVSLDQLEQVVLLYEEIEALRLADLEGFYQVEAAAQMAVSRSTFQRVLLEARRKVALALNKGLAIRVEGGTFRLLPAWLHCSACGYDWQKLHGSGQGEVAVCPNCGSELIRPRHRERRRHSR